MTKFDVKFTGDKVTLHYDFVIWNAYTRDDLDPEYNLTKEDWLNFVQDQNQNFAESTGEIVHDLFDVWCKENKKGEYKDEC